MSCRSPLGSRDHPKTIWVLKRGTWPFSILEEHWRLRYQGLLRRFGIGPSVDITTQFYYIYCIITYIERDMNERYKGIAARRDNLVLCDVVSAFERSIFGKKNSSSWKLIPRFFMGYVQIKSWSESYTKPET